MAKTNAETTVNSSLTVDSSLIENSLPTVTINLTSKLQEVQLTLLNKIKFGLANGSDPSGLVNFSVIYNNLK